MNPRLTPTDVRVWCALAFLARGRDYTEATDDAIGKQLAVSPRTVRDSLSRLDHESFIERRRHGEARRITLVWEGNGEPAEGMALRIHE
jgi:transcription initiation factor IIE alpha subunit